MKLGRPVEQRIYRIFLSSGDDVSVLRDRIDELVNEAINSQLLEAGEQVRLEVDRWERTVPQSVDPAKHTNAVFVDRALDSSLTLTLLLDELGSGTREEIEATLAANKEVSALWFVQRGSKPDSPVAEFLNQNKQRLIYHQAGPPESDQSWIGIVRVLTRVVVEALREERQELYTESRGGL